jgi:hypothetical protein
MQRRRQFLAGGGSVATAMALSGCSMLPWFGDDDSFEFGEYNDYREWLPGNSGEGQLIAANPANVVDVNLVESDEGIFGTPTGRIAHLIRAQLGGENLLIAIGEYEVESAVEGFESQEAIETTSNGQYEGFAMFSASGSASDEPPTYQTFAATEEIAIAGGSQELVTTVIDAEAGNARLLVDQNEDFGTVTEEIGNEDWMEFTIGQASSDPDQEGAPALVTGLGFDISSEESSFTEVLVYGGEGDALLGAERVNQHWKEQREGTSAVDASVDGRVVIVTGTQETDHIF